MIPFFFLENAMRRAGARPLLLHLGAQGGGRAVAGHIIAPDSAAAREAGVPIITAASGVPAFSMAARRSG